MITIGSSKMVYSYYYCLRETMERKKGKNEGKSNSEGRRRFD